MLVTSATLVRCTLDFVMPVVFFKGKDLKKKKNNNKNTQNCKIEWNPKKTHLFWQHDSRKTWNTMFEKDSYQRLWRFNMKHTNYLLFLVIIKMFYDYWIQSVDGNDGKPHQSSNTQDHRWRQEHTSRQSREASQFWHKIDSSYKFLIITMIGHLKLSSSETILRIIVIIITWDKQ